jgi:RNA polymerase sigma factor (sigma-70 family)
MTSNLSDGFPVNEHELVKRCQAGDPTAFALLIEQHRARLMRLLRALLGHRHEIEDVWQETLLRAYFNLDQLREAEKFGAWLCSIAVNLARTGRSARGPRLVSWEALADEPTEQRSGAGSGVEAAVAQRELTRRVRQAIDDLPPGEQAAVLLVYLEGLSHKEVATQLGTSLSAVKVRVHRGRRRLQQALQSEVEPMVQRVYKEHTMIQVHVQDVLYATSVKPDATDVAVATEQVARQSSRVILLKGDSSERILPIWVGSFEGDALAMHLKQEESKRPLTFDLLKTLLALGQVTVEQVTVARLVENTYYSNLLVHAGASTVEVDCRPSDAINLALRLNVPILVAEEVLEQAGKAADDPWESDVVWESVLTKGA